jgi:DNA replication and repair protein RecF
MALATLEIQQFRCFEGLSLRCDPHYNLCIGANASGKTSLLEAIFFLGRARSFRTRRLGNLVRDNAPEFLIVGQSEGRGSPLTLGIRGMRSSTEIRIGGVAGRPATELARHFAPYVIDPEVHRLLEDGPNRRRRFLDWGVFHVEPAFLPAWQRYYRALRQRNALLRSGADEVLLLPWDSELVESGLRLSDQRRRYLERLAPTLHEIGRALLDQPVALLYQDGWRAGDSLGEALVASRPRDRRYGLTHVGPHRADLAVRVADAAARERVSRGQQKLLAAAMTLAQLTVQEREDPGHGALLLDDPAAELDAGGLARLVELVRSLPVQLFVTSLGGQVPGLGVPGATFHVEQGRLQS